MLALYWAPNLSWFGIDKVSRHVLRVLVDTCVKSKVPLAYKPVSSSRIPSSINLTYPPLLSKNKTNPALGSFLHNPKVWTM